jgi:Carboxypeptidase regulatory-like domain
MGRRGTRVVLLTALVFLPTTVFAQASITGTVKDPSGAVLPGVTVAASSDVLIEKVRTATTDATGQYRIVDLRPGTYMLTITLVGFNTFKRDGIELSGTFTATINAELKVGAIEETVTVTAESPIVDTQSVRRQTILGNDVIASLPAARAYAGLMQLIPSSITQAGNALDIQVTPGMLVFGGSGGRNNEGRIQVDGLNTGAAFNGAGVSSYVPDIGNAQEIAMTTSGGLGEAEVGGPTLSIVPKTGGNTFKGTVYQSNVTDGMVGDNYTQDLKDRGLTTPGRLFKLWDTNIGVGGPMVADRIWFFGQFRDEGSHRTVPGMFANANFGDPTKRTYVADRSRPAVSAGSWRNAALRLTIQATPRNKFNAFWDEQKPCQGAAFPGVDQGCRQSGPNEIICGAPGASNPGCNATNAPETGTYLGSGGQSKGQHVQQITWSSPVTSRLLLEAGFGTYLSRWGGAEMPGNPSRDIVRVVENCARGCADNGNIAGLTYRSEDWNSHYQGPVSWRGSATYATGAHSMKFGYQGAYLIDNRQQYTNNQYLQYRTQNGIPDQITEMIRNYFFSNRTRYDAVYAQEMWTLGRWTFQGAIRFDRAWSWFPEATIGPVRFLPTAVTYAQTPGVDSYKDITPRAGVAWDVFGTGKTAVKVNLGRYLEAAQNDNSYIVSRPTGRVRTTTTRTWTDANNNFTPDCDLLNPLAQDLRPSGGDFCGQINDLSFGDAVFDTTQDPSALRGWGVRPADWQFGASIQHQLLPRVSVDVGYVRRWLQNFFVTDNLAQQPSDMGSFYVVAPLDARLPNGGGYTISSLYNPNQNVASLNNNLVTKARDYGDQYQHSNSVVFNITARPSAALFFQGGFNLGSGVSDACAVRAKIPELNGQATIWGNTGGAGVGTSFTTINATNPWCHVETGFVKRATGLGSWTIPRIDVQVAGTFRSDQGQALAALFTVPNADIQPILGRALANNAPNVTVNLIQPGTLYGDRVNEIDLRIAKILRVGRTRINIGVDMYNIINTAAILTYNQNYIPTGNWLVPTGVLQPRFVKFSATFDF